MKTFREPLEVMRSLSDSGVKKVTRPLYKTLILAILAGVYIGFAGQLAMVAGTGEIAWSGAKKILMGSVFSLGLMLVMIPGADLFTGNTLITIPLLEKKTRLSQLLMNWAVVYGGNFLGSFLLTLLLVYPGNMLSGEVGQTVVQVASGKASLTWAEALARGIGANWLVCLAVWFALSSDSLEGKILGIFFPVMGFVAMGFEHSVANMYILTAGRLALPSLSLPAGLIPWEGIATNLIFSTIGNIIGGGLFVGGIYWYLYLKEEN